MGTIWIISAHGFISLVQDRNDPDCLQVRARVADDITAAFPDATVKVSEGGDYRYRAVISRMDVADRVWDMIDDIDYTSHVKDVITKTSPPNSERRPAYYEVWTALARMQDYRPYSRVPRALERPVAYVPSSRLHGWDDLADDTDDCGDSDETMSAVERAFGVEPETVDEQTLDEMIDYLERAREIPRKKRRWPWV